MLLPIQNRLSKSLLLLAGLLLWCGGAQAENSLQDLSEKEGVTCKQGDLRSCLIYYYALPTDLSGELAQTNFAGNIEPLSDEPQSSGLSPLLKKVYVLLDKKPRSDGQQSLHEFIEEELEQLWYVPTGDSEIDDKNKKRVKERWAAFDFMLKRLELEASGKETVFGYRQEDLSLDDTLGEVSKQLDSSLSKESNLRELIIRWTNFMLPIAATLAALGLVWAGFLYITSFQDESRLEEAKKVILMVIVGVALVGGSYAIVSTIVTRVF